MKFLRLPHYFLKNYATEVEPDFFSELCKKVYILYRYNNCQLIEREFSWAEDSVGEQGPKWTEYSEKTYS